MCQFLSTRSCLLPIPLTPNLDVDAFSNIDSVMCFKDFMCPLSFEKQKSKRACGLRVACSHKDARLQIGRLCGRYSKVMRVRTSWHGIYIYLHATHFITWIVKALHLNKRLLGLPSRQPPAPYNGLFNYTFAHTQSALGCE